MRKAEDPKDAPEEPYGKLKLIEIGLNLWKKILDDIYYYYLLFILDHRSLFERLEENKRAKDAENTTEPMEDYEMMTNFNEKIHSGCHPIHTFMKGTSQGIELFQD